MSGFSHPNFGKEITIEVIGKRVCLTFHAGTVAQAEDLAKSFLAQLNQGGLHLTVMGQPTSVEES
jgi:hypothetical protein